MEDWSSGRKIAFRFLFPFFIFWTAVWNSIPYVNSWINKFYYYPSFFVQNYILKLTETPKWEHSPTGSGDTLDDWILLLTYVILSLVIFVIWSIFDRKAKNYQKLESGLVIGLRYYLAFVMCGYGIYKLFLLQMPYPSLVQFHTPLGEFTPMRFTWLHIGYSPYYQFIGGFLETLGGLLILFRRTRVLGGIILLGVLSQVVMLNYFYGVPVKIFSSFLLIVTIYIIKDDLIILGKLILGKSNQTIDILPFQTDSIWIKRIRIVLKFGFICYAFGYSFYSVKAYYDEQNQIENIELYGAYEVLNYRKNDTEVSSILDKERWNYIVFGEGFSENRSSTLIRKGFSDYQKASTTLFSTDSIKINLIGDTPGKFIGRFQKNDNEIELSGLLNSDTLLLKLSLDNREQVLPDRKFKWIMEQTDF